MKMSNRPARPISPSRAHWDFSRLQNTETFIYYVLLLPLDNSSLQSFGRPEGDVRRYGHSVAQHLNRTVLLGWRPFFAAHKNGLLEVVGLLEVLGTGPKLVPAESRLCFDP